MHLLFFCYLVLLMSYPRVITNPMSWSFPHVSSKNFIVLAFTFRTLIHIELIFVYGLWIREGFNFISFVFECLLFPALVLRKMVLSTLNGLGKLVENYLVIFVVLSLASLFYSSLYVYLCTTIILFWLLIVSSWYWLYLCSKFWKQEIWDLQTQFFFIIVLAILNPLRFQCNFRIDFLLLQKKILLGFR